MGRLITFVARLLNDVWAPNGALGIGVDEVRRNINGSIEFWSELFSML